MLTVSHLSALTEATCLQFLQALWASIYSLCNLTRPCKAALEMQTFLPLCTITATSWPVGQQYYWDHFPQTSHSSKRKNPQLACVARRVQWAQMIWDLHGVQESQLQRFHPEAAAGLTLLQQTSALPVTATMLGKPRGAGSAKTAESSITPHCTCKGKAGFPRDTTTNPSSLCCSSKVLHWHCWTVPSAVQAEHHSSDLKPTRN